MNAWFVFLFFFKFLLKKSLIYCKVSNMWLNLDKKVITDTLGGESFVVVYQKPDNKCLICWLFLKLSDSSYSASHHNNHRPFPPLCPPLLLLPQTLAVIPPSLWNIYDSWCLNQELASVYRLIMGQTTPVTPPHLCPFGSWHVLANTRAQIILTAKMKTRNPKIDLTWMTLHIIMQRVQFGTQQFIDKKLKDFFWKTLRLQLHVAKIILFTRHILYLFKTEIWAITWILGTCLLKFWLQAVQVLSIIRRPVNTSCFDLRHNYYLNNCWVCDLLI